MGKGLAWCPWWWRRHQTCAPVAAVAAPCGEQIPHKQIPREQIPQDQIHREVQVRGASGAAGEGAPSPGSARTPASQGTKLIWGPE